MTTDEEIQAAALQFVRKVSGYRKPSRANQEAFDKAVMDIAEVTRTLLNNIGKADRIETAVPNRDS